METELSFSHILQTLAVEVWRTIMLYYTNLIS